MVVRVVVKDRSDGAGEENVLSAPLPTVLGPTVPAVPAPEEAAWDCAASECATSCSVETVWATDLLPIVAGAIPSTEERNDRLLWSSDEVLAVRPVGTDE